MTLDIEKFHRRTPICPAQKRWFVMQGRKDEFFIQHCAPFGARSSEGNSGEISSCSVDIWRCQGVGPTTKWCDDLTVFRFPSGGCGSSSAPFSYDYDREKALNLISPLRIPWHPLENKGQDFLPSFTYVGLSWNIPLRQVRLPEEKRLKYLFRTQSFLTAFSDTSNKCSLQTLLKLQGVFVHISFVYTQGPSYIAPLSRFASSFEGVMLRERYPPASVIRAVEWWRDQLLVQDAFRKLRPRLPVTHLDIFVDASTDWGIGILIMGKWIAWRTFEGWRGPGRDIGWLEGVAVEMVIYILDLLDLQDCCVKVRSDNVGIIGAFNKGRSRNFEVNLSIRRAASVMAAKNITLDLEYIETTLNPADPISRGDLGPTNSRLDLEVPLPEELAPFLSRV